MRNSYKIVSDEAIIILVHKGEIVETRISLTDLARACEYPNTWNAKWDPHTSSYYVRGMVTIEGSRKTIWLHRWLLDAPKELDVDHFDNNTLNNTRTNLRLTTRAKNGQNRKGARRDSKSGIRGVFWCEKKKKWDTQIRVDTKLIRVGYFSSVEEAELAVKLARAELMPGSKEARRCEA